MPAPTTDLVRIARIESELTSALERQTRVFAAAFAAIERVHSQAQLTDPSSESVIGQLQRSLEQVTAAQISVASANQKLVGTGADISPSLRRSLAQQELSLKDLLEKINAVQPLFESARSALIPQLDDDVRRRTMQSAYRQSLRTV